MFKSLERKIGMEIVQKLIASFIERSCGNYVTTIVGILCALVAGFNYLGFLVPVAYQGYVSMFIVIVAGVALVLAKDKGIKVDVPTPAKLPMILLALFVLPCMAHAQTAAPAPTPAAVADAASANFYAGGIAWNQSGNPQIGGNVIYGHEVSSDTVPHMYFVSILDILPTGNKPFTATTNIGAGVAQQVTTIAGFPLFYLATTGLTINGPNTGWNYDGGIATTFNPFKKKCPSCFLMPHARFLKASVSNGSGYQPIVGIDFGIHR